MQKRKATEPKERAKVRQWKNGKELRGGKVVVSTPSTIVDTMPIVSLCEHNLWVKRASGPAATRARVGVDSRDGAKNGGEGENMVGPKQCQRDNRKAHQQGEICLSYLGPLWSVCVSAALHCSCLYRSTTLTKLCSVLATKTM